MQYVGQELSQLELLVGMEAVVTKQLGLKTNP